MSALVQLLLVAGVVALGVAVASLVPAITRDRPHETEHANVDDYDEAAREQQNTE